jgi:predicted GIY-YIG superfamily endonuclease
MNQHHGRSKEGLKKLLNRLGLDSYSVYRLYNARGTLLYIGMANDVKARIKGHYNNTDNPWIIKCSRIEISEPYPTQEEARTAEKLAQDLEDPRYGHEGLLAQAKWYGYARVVRLGRAKTREMMDNLNFSAEEVIEWANQQQKIDRSWHRENGGRYFWNAVRSETRRPMLQDIHHEEAS